MVKIVLILSIIALLFGSIYLVKEGISVYKLFANSIVGRLVKTLVIVLMVMLYSLGAASMTFILFAPNESYVLLPVMILWMCSLVYAVYAISQANLEVNKSLNKNKE